MGFQVFFGFSCFFLGFFMVSLWFFYRSSWFCLSFFIFILGPSMIGLSLGVYFLITSRVLFGKSNLHLPVFLTLGICHSKRERISSEDLGTWVLQMICYTFGLTIFRVFLRGWCFVFLDILITSRSLSLCFQGVTHLKRLSPAFTNNQNCITKENHLHTVTLKFLFILRVRNLFKKKKVKKKKEGTEGTSGAFPESGAPQGFLDPKSEVKMNSLKSSVTSGVFPGAHRFSPVGPWEERGGEEVQMLMPTLGCTRYTGILAFLCVIIFLF